MAGTITPLLQAYTVPHSLVLYRERETMQEDTSSSTAEVPSTESSTPLPTIVRMDSSAEEMMHRVEDLVKRLDAQGLTVVVLPNGKPVIYGDQRKKTIIEGQGALRYLNSQAYSDCVLVLQPSRRSIFASAGRKEEKKGIG